MSCVIIRLLAASGIILAASSAAMAETVIYDATGGAENGGDSFASAGRILVDQVQTGGTASTLSSVTLNLYVDKAKGRAFNVVLATLGLNNKPVRVRSIATLSDHGLPVGKFGLVTVTPAGAITLAPNTAYYVGIQQSGHPALVHLGNTVDPAVLARPSVIAGGWYYNNGGYQANAGGPYEIKVTTTP